MPDQPRPVKNPAFGFQIWSAHPFVFETPRVVPADDLCGSMETLPSIGFCLSVGFQITVCVLPCGCRSGALSQAGAVAVLANLNNVTQVLTLSNSVMPPTRSGTKTWNILEAFSGKKLLGASLPLNFTVGPRDVAMLVLSTA